MISEQEALHIAHSYVLGQIVKESCDKYYITRRKNPVCWRIVIYHVHDSILRKTDIEIIPNGTVSSWDTQVIDEIDNIADILS